MSEMIERGARAICQKRCVMATVARDPCTGPCGADERMLKFNGYWSASADVIEAMREPSDAMIAAGKAASGVLVDASSSAGGPRWCELPDDETRRAFRAMIERALTD